MIKRNHLKMGLPLTVVVAPNDGGMVDAVRDGAAVEKDDGRWLYGRRGWREIQGQVDAMKDGSDEQANCSWDAQICRGIVHCFILRNSVGNRLAGANSGTSNSEVHGTQSHLARTATDWALARNHVYDRCTLVVLHPLHRLCHLVTLSPGNRRKRRMTCFALKDFFGTESAWFLFCS